MNGRFHMPIVYTENHDTSEVRIVRDDNAGKLFHTGGSCGDVSAPKGERMGLKDAFAFWLAYLAVFWPFLLIALGVLIGVYLLLIYVL